ncbi:hypothetical protein ACFXTI_027680 [Malus domestica]
MIFIGHGNCEKGYRVYDLLSKRIVLFRSVVFTKDKHGIWRVIRWTLNMETENAEGESQEESQEITHFDAVNTLKYSCHFSTSVSDTGTQSQNSTPSSTLMKLRSLEDIYARCHMCIIEIENYHEAADNTAWQDVMNAEIEMIEKNDTWELVERLANKPIIAVKWVFKTKLNLDRTVQKHKARLVAKGYA